VILFPSLIFLSSVLFWFIKPEIVQYLFLGNLWLLSYPHTFATFTRSYFSSKGNKLKAFVAIILFFAFNLWVLYLFDFVILINIYFYSQFFHYVRQNFGISKIGSSSWKVLDSVIFHLFHLCLLVFFFRLEHSFLGFKLYQPDLSEIFYTLGGFGVLLFGVYFLIRFRSIDKKVFIYLSLGGLMTFNETSFILGWLGLHLFHNSQYLVMNWNLNPKENFYFHYGKIVILVFVIYKSAQFIEDYLISGLSIVFCLILAVNYSHYFFDSYLWKRKYRLQYP
jgi:hypothetical protein